MYMIWYISPVLLFTKLFCLFLQNAVSCHQQLHNNHDITHNIKKSSSFSVLLLASFLLFLAYFSELSRLSFHSSLTIFFYISFFEMRRDLGIMSTIKCIIIIIVIISNIIVILILMIIISTLFTTAFSRSYKSQVRVKNKNMTKHGIVMAEVDSIAVVVIVIINLSVFFFFFSSRFFYLFWKQRWYYYEFTRSMMA